MRDLEALNVRDFWEEAVRQAPDSVFLIHGEEHVSYREFNGRVDQAASAWFRLGVRKGDRVAFMLENRPEFLQCWLGLAKIGGILVAINTRWQSAEVEYFLELCEPRYALVSEPHRDVFRSAIRDRSTLDKVLTFGEDASFIDFGTSLTEPAGDMPHVNLVAGDPISFISTSGTTGRPKAVMQTHGNYVLTGEGYAGWVELQSSERIYLCLPLFHINSQTYTVMGAIAARAGIVLVERFSASRFWSDMRQYHVNVFNHIGSMLVVLMKRDPAPEELAHEVRLTYGGPALPGPVRAEVEERFGFTVISGIGMSETTFGLIEPLHQARRSGSLGTVRQHPDPRIRNEACVVDDDGRDVATGEVGELVFRSPVQMKGYYRDPEQTANTIRDGWLHTGDLVRQDADGYFYFVDRKKDIIRVRGENVSSSEVEQALNEHPDVQDASVVGVPSELTDEDIAAFVVARPGSQPAAEELAAWCRSRLASFKVPHHVWLVPSLPKTETLRTEKHRLRADALRRLETPAPMGSGDRRSDD
ncbi:MAG TPA: AMP-binding protein [Chloroflexota bacterium]